MLKTNGRQGGPLPLGSQLREKQLAVRPGSLEQQDLLVFTPLAQELGLAS